MIERIPNNLVKIIEEGEGIITEFKESSKKLPNNLFETICSMLNRNGGHIFLGIKDNKEIIGIDKSIINDIKKEFTSLCNNPEKIFPTVYLDIKEYIYKKKHILYIYVHESSDVHKTKNKFYDRNQDGDYDITNNTTLISNLYIRKRSTYAENKIYPYATMSDLREDIISEVRQMAINKTTNHPWSTMSNEELLRSAGLYERNLETGKEGFNLACLLLFGKDEVINSALSYFKTDAILKVKDVERYDDRDDIKTNLIDSYKRLINFVSKHLEDKFYIEGDKRVSVRDLLARELCVNLLIHREFSNPYPAKLIITKDAIITENANKTRSIGYIDLNNYSPYPKNPKIANVFKEIGLADELGSGIKKMIKYNMIYSGARPSFKEDDVFIATIPLVLQQTIKVSNDYVKIRYKLLEFIKESKMGRTRREINEFMYPLLDGEEKEKDNKVRTALTYLRKKEFITNIGADSSPLWLINDEK